MRVPQIPDLRWIDRSIHPRASQTNAPSAAGTARDSTRIIEERHGFAGALRTTGGYGGPFRAPRVTKSLIDLLGTAALGGGGDDGRLGRRAVAVAVSIAVAERERGLHL